MTMTTTTFYSYIDSPLGTIFVQGDHEFVTGLYMPQHKRWPGPDPAWQQCDSAFTAIRHQLDEYFGGVRRTFDVPLKLAGTPFQIRVWHELVKIPFGSTITYSQLAKRVGNPSASRAVGNANARNPISIVVPCHRVTGADGTLAGYAGGIDKKKWLLEWEQRVTI